MKRTITFLAAVILLLSLHIPASATESTVDMEQTGSITLFKYDFTSANGNGVPVSSFVATGEKDLVAETALADYAIQGVKFTYLKVADLSSRTTEAEDGTANVSLLYTMGASDKTAALLNAIGLNYDDAYVADGNTYHFTSDVLSDALHAAMSDSTSAKNKLENYVKANGGTTLAETDANGKTVASALPLGLYLMVETYIPENVVCTVNPFFVSVPMTTVDGAEWQYAVTVYPKNETGNPTLAKSIREAMQDTGKTTDYAHSGTASIGDVVEYEIVSKLPTITSEASYLTAYTFVDTLSKGLSYNKQDLTISFYTDASMENKIASWSETEGKFTVSYGMENNSATMTIVMTADGLAEMNAAKTVCSTGSMTSGYSDCYIVIHYDATVNNDAILGDAGNSNEVVLTWQRSNTEYYDTLGDDCHVYSYGVDLLKQFHDENNADADGDFTSVKFLLRNETDNYFVAADLIDGVYFVRDHLAEETDATVFVPDAHGRILVRGLEDDIYYLKETATDSGYQLLAEEVKIEIIAAESKTLCSICGKAFLTAAAKVTDQDITMTEDGTSANALVPLTIINNHGFDLPPTGGRGTQLLTVLGIVGMALCGTVIVILLKKRRSTTA